MDVFSHILFGNLTRLAIDVRDKQSSVALISATVIPDIGEVFIQNALAKKYNAKFAVYDLRTSDIAIAGDLSITWYYDLFHSFVFALFLFLLSKYILESKLVWAFALGLFSHILLDCCTHGTVWALKLLFPLSNQRFEMLSGVLGNWWDWQPTINLSYLGFQLPMACFLFWLALIIASLVVYKNQK